MEEFEDKAILPWWREAYYSSLGGGWGGFSIQPGGDSSIQPGGAGSPSSQGGFSIQLGGGSPSSWGGFSIQPGGVLHPAGGVSLPDPPHCEQNDRQV